MWGLVERQGCVSIYDVQLVFLGAVQATMALTNMRPRRLVLGGQRVVTAAQAILHHTEEQIVRWPFLQVYTEATKVNSEEQIVDVPVRSPNPGGNG